MKKILFVAACFIISLLSVLYINQLFKFIITLIFNIQYKLSFLGVGLDVVLQNHSAINHIEYFFIMAVPLLASILFIEFAFILLARSRNERTRIGLIVFQLTNIGYLLYAVFLGIFTIVFKSAYSRDWNSVFLQQGLSYNQKLLVLFLLMMLLLAYINILTKRVKKIIPVVKQN